MPSKKYTIRDGFVVVLERTLPNGDKSERRYEGGELVELDEETAAGHLHKLEFAEKADRKAALAAEEEARLAAAANSNPVDLVKMLSEALVQAMVAAGVQSSAQAPQA